MLTEDDKRVLTEEMLGEEWHKYRISRGRGDGVSTCSCGMTGMRVRDICSYANRSFTDPKDTFDLKKKIVEMGEWRDFALFAAGEWDKTLTLNPTENFIVEVFTDWLMDPIRFPELVAGWVRERKGKE